MSSPSITTKKSDPFRLSSSSSMLSITAILKEYLKFEEINIITKHALFHNVDAINIILALL